jgi:DNA helicase HerA-like ATPase
MSTATDGIIIGKAAAPVFLDLRYANRHGLVAGATGTGKTVTLQAMTEGFSSRGVPVFLVDVKGDLSGLCAAGEATGPFADRARQLDLGEYRPRAFPVVFWDVFGEQGHPIRATVSEMGPLLLARLLQLNDTQEGVLNAAFAVADGNGLLLLDLKDLRAILQFVSENAKELQGTYGNIAPTTVGAIQRKLLVVERESGDTFFGEPALDLKDLMQVDKAGQGIVSILAADRLIDKPRLYATFLLWLLSELFEELPEIGDRDRPKLVLFFDEAHLLFDDAPKALIDKVEQVVRLIRSKGVGVFFVTQNPTDVPEDVLGQLGNRVQHALRAFTAKDQRAVKAAAETFRANPDFRVEQAITQLAVGEALVSMLEDKGTPGIVQRTLIAPPASRVGPALPSERQAVFAASPMAGRYDIAIDRESAYEQLRARAETLAPRQAPEPAAPVPAPRPRARGRKPPASFAEAFANSAARSIGSEIVRGVLGSLFRGR